MCVCMSVTSHRNGQQLQDPQVEPHLNQNDGPGQEDEVDVAGSVGASLPLEEAGRERAGPPREVRRGREGPQSRHSVFENAEKNRIQQLIWLLLELNSGI